MCKKNYKPRLIMARVRYLYIPCWICKGLAVHIVFRVLRYSQRISVIFVGKNCSVVLAHLDDLNYEVSNFVLAVGSSDLI